MRFPAFFFAVLAASAAMAGDVTVTDDSGRSVTLPEQPERIVVLHEPLLGIPLMDLGVTPVASYGRAEDGSNLTALDFVDIILGPGTEKPGTGIGPIGNIDLEKLGRLDPDLILATEFDIDKAERFSAVAPVYLKSVSTGVASGISVQEDLAELLGLQDRFKARKADYLERVAALRDRFADKIEGKSYVAIFLTDQVNLIGEMSGAVQALKDLGYKRAEVTDFGAAKGSGSTLFMPLSPEVFVRLNPDVMILMGTYAKENRSESAVRKRLSQIVPGWENFLRPAKENRLMFLDSAEVSTPTVASAEHTVDAVEAWLSER